MNPEKPSQPSAKIEDQNEESQVVERDFNREIENLDIDLTLFQEEEIVKILQDENIRIYGNFTAVNYGGSKSNYGSRELELQKKAWHGRVPPTLYFIKMMKRKTKNLYISRLILLLILKL